MSQVIEQHTENNWFGAGIEQLNQAIIQHDNLTALALNLIQNISCYVHAESGYLLISDRTNSDDSELHFRTICGYPSDMQASDDNQVVLALSHEAAHLKKTLIKQGVYSEGLSLARKLAQRMNGCIQHYNAPDHGSVFSLYLPIQPIQTN